ncbi:MAG: exosortase VPDSG-CTERM-specific [Acidobacteriaceae bacterium]|nr:exosortase VPDSG-CTERM-specific [Acidobacteriaceae bacterium]
MTVTSRTASSHSHSRSLVLTSLLTVSSFIFLPAITELFRSAYQNDEYTHILLVLPVSLCLIYLESRNISLQPEYAPRLGLFLIFVSAVIWWTGDTHVLVLGRNGWLSVRILALVALCIGCIIGCCGLRIFRALSFPVLFLLLLIPPPTWLLDRTIIFLQQASTDATFALFKLSGTPVMKDGFVLSLPMLQIEVAKQCSGIRSSEMLLITGLILAHLFLRTFWSKIIFVAFIVPMAIAKNAIRVFTLAMLGMHVNPDFLEGRLHHEGGGVFFALALGVLLLLLWILQKVEGRMLAKSRRRQTGVDLVTEVSS